jgi:LDH2 family malate/lactate/ureidoglycolate dehydrogenase
MSITFTYDQLFRFSKNIFLAIGCNDHDAETATKSLLSADLRGVDSHGVARLSGYVRLWEAERVNAQPHIKIVHETPSTAVVDGDKGLGLVVAPFAMQVAIEKAKAVGTGWVSVKNSNHFGIAGYHAMMALEHDMIGIAMKILLPLLYPRAISLHSLQILQQPQLPMANSRSCNERTWKRQQDGYRIRTVMYQPMQVN